MGHLAFQSWDGAPPLPPRRSDLLVYNRVPKSGSSSLSSALRALSGSNGFAVRGFNERYLCPVEDYDADVCSKEQVVVVAAVVIVVVVIVAVVVVIVVVVIVVVAVAAAVFQLKVLETSFNLVSFSEGKGLRNRGPFY